MVFSIGADRSLPLSIVEQFQRRVAAQPEVENAAVAWWSVFQGNRRMERVIVPGSKPSERQEIFYRVSPNYLATLGTRLLQGRDLTFVEVLHATHALANVSSQSRRSPLRSCSKADRFTPSSI